MKISKAKSKSEKNNKSLKNTFKFALTFDQKKELKLIFDGYDREGKSLLTSKELILIIRNIGFELLDEDMKKYCFKVDDDKYDFEDLVKIIEIKISENSDIDGLKSVFHNLCEVSESSEKIISLNSLREILNRLGEDISDEELKEMMMEANPELRNNNSDKEVMDESFYKITRKQFEELLEKLKVS